MYRRSQEVHRQRLYTQHKLQGELKMAGFNVSGLPGYGTEHFGSRALWFRRLEPLDLNIGLR